MLRVARLAAAALSALALSACATSMNVSSYAGHDVDFSRYRTYDWGPADTLPVGDPRLDKDPFFQDHMLGAVEKQMAAKGYEHAASGQSDLIVHYHAAVNQRLDVNRVDTASGYCAGADCQRPLEYEAGTLVIDVIDAHTHAVIWRGWAQDSMEGVIDDRGKLERRINESVTRMLEKLPSRR